MTEPTQSQLLRLLREERARKEFAAVSIALNCWIHAGKILPAEKSLNGEDPRVSGQEGGEVRREAELNRCDILCNQLVSE